jgi:hypothetical protein
MRKHEILLVTGFLMVSGCETDKCCELPEDLVEIKHLEKELVKRQRAEYEEQLAKQEAEIQKTEAELAKLERKNYLKSLRLELLQLKDERNAELAAQMEESRGEEFRLKLARNRLNNEKIARIRRMRSAPKIDDSEGLRAEIEELRLAVVDQKVKTERMTKSLAEYAPELYERKQGLTSQGQIVEPEVVISPKNDGRA